MTQVFNLTGNEVSEDRKEATIRTASAFKLMAELCSENPISVADGMISALVNYLVNHGATLHEVAESLSRAALALDPPEGTA